MAMRDMVYNPNNLVVFCTKLTSVLQVTKNCLNTPASMVNELNGCIKLRLDAHVTGQ